MSDRYTIEAAAMQFHASIDWLPSRARSAIVIGAWLALTVLFLFASVVLIGAVVTALGPSLRVLTSLIALVGVLAACGVAPTLAWIAIATAAEQFEDSYDWGTDDEPSGFRRGSSGPNKAGHCQSPGVCCC